MNKLLINKYQPSSLDYFSNKNNNEIIQFINKLIDTNELRIIIFGNVGTGKSTLINNILYKYYKSQRMSSFPLEYGLSICHGFLSLGNL